MEPLARIELVDCPNYGTGTRLTEMSCGAFWAAINVLKAKPRANPRGRFATDYYVGSFSREPCLGCRLGAERALGTGQIEAARAMPRQTHRLIAYRRLVDPNGPGLEAIMTKPGHIVVRRRQRALKARIAVAAAAGPMPAQNGDHPPARIENKRGAPPAPIPHRSPPVPTKVVAARAKPSPKKAPKRRPWSKAGPEELLRRAQRVLRRVRGLTR